MRQRKFTAILSLFAFAVWLAVAIFSPDAGPVRADTAKVLVAGGEHNCVITSQDEVRCWGGNETGALGNNDPDVEASLLPIEVCSDDSCAATLGNIDRIAAGQYHTCAIQNITTTGALLCWGENFGGQLGDGTTIHKYTPVPVCTVAISPCPPGSELTGVMGVGVGDFHTCALVAPGSASTGWHAKCWGSNGAIQLGANSEQTCPSRDDPNVFGDCSTTPLDVCAPGADPCNSMTLLDGVTSIAPGGAHTCALWDDDDPVTTGYGIRCWGDNTRGALGDGRGNATTQGSSTPVDVCEIGSWDPDELACRPPCWPNQGCPADNTALTGVDAVSSGTDHSCALVDAGSGPNYLAKCWGWNKCGQIGNGIMREVGFGLPLCPHISFDSNNFDVVEPLPVAVCADAACETVLDNVAAIEAQFMFSCAVMNDSSARCWGWNPEGELGDGSTTHRATADKFVCGVSECDQNDPLDALTGIAALESGYFEHVCVRMADDSVKCWGNNHEDQLGAHAGEVCRGPHSCSTTPLDVIGFAVSGGGLADSDLDGCTNKAEVQTVQGGELTGGLRNPEYFWDFFDVWSHPPDQPTVWVRDKVINVPGDIIGVAIRFGPGTVLSKEDALAAALTPPTSDSGYHAAFDRGPVIGANNWNRAPADGAINIPDDIIGVAFQFGTNCA